MNQDYADLLTKVDTFVREKTERFQNQITCKPGCFDCCVAKLTVTKIEAEAIVEYVNDNKLTLPREAIHKNHCMNLDVEGRCLIYPVRPIVCRTHGLPIDYKSENESKKKGENTEKNRSVCPKNFTKESIAKLDPTDVLNGDTINLILGMINMKYFEKIERVSLEKLNR